MSLVTEKRRAVLAVKKTFIVSAVFCTINTEMRRLWSNVKRMVISPQVNTEKHCQTNPKTHLEVHYLYKSTVDNIMFNHIINYLFWFIFTNTIYTVYCGTTQNEMFVSLII